MSVISEFSNILPKFKLSQLQSIEWLSECHRTSIENSLNSLESEKKDWKRLFDRFGVKAEQIAERWTECPDITAKSLWHENLIYQLKPEQTTGVNTEQRTLFYAKRAREIFHEFYSGNYSPPDHLLHVTCTGYISPSAAQSLVVEKKWRGSIGVTHAYHMGCYAALPAVRIASAFASDNLQVDIVHTEMCTLHLNPSIHTPEQLVVQSLFADGHIKYSVTNVLPENAEIGLRVLKIREWLLPDSQEDMSWIPAAWGMKMTLSRNVPEKIMASIKVCFLEMLEESRIEPRRAMNAIFAIHPGGPKIIDAVEKCLELKMEQTKHSHYVLHTRGNMSSATLPHIWEEILKTKPDAGTLVVSFAFGPGLTIFGSLLEIVKK